MISKDKFVKIIDYIQETWDIAEELSSVARKSASRLCDFDGYVFIDDVLEDYLIEVLEEMFGDTVNHWIRYYVYGCDCGRRSLINEVVDENGDYVDITTPDKLYDFLLHNIANRI